MCWYLVHNDDIVDNILNQVCAGYPSVQNSLLLNFQDHIDKLALTAEEVKGYQTASWRRWQQYIEPGDEQVGTAITSTDSALRQYRTLPLLHYSTI
jgi:hypothetical protein